MFKIAKQIRISAKLDKSGFQKELNQLLKKGYDLNLNGGNFKSVVNDITKELNKLKSTLNNVNGNTFDNTTSGINKTKDAVKDLNSELTRMSSKNLSSTSIIADKNGLSEINKYKDGIAQTTSEVIKNGQVTKQVVTENISQFNNLKNQLQNKLNVAKGNSFIDDSVLTNLQTKLNSINTNTPEKEFNELKNAINNLSSSDSGIVRLQNSITKLQERIANIRKNKIDIVDSSDINEIKQVENEILNLRNMLTQLKAGDVIDGKKISSSISQATNSVRTLEGEFRSVNTITSGLATTMKSIFSYAVGGSLVYTLINEVKEGISSIIELDTALRDLRKVSDLSSQQLKEFTKTASEMGSEIGATTKSIITATEYYSKLGYAIEEASARAKNATIFSNVADMNIDDASKALITIQKGFDLNTLEDMTRIMDVANEVGNNYSSSSKDVADGLLRMGNALNEAGNSYEQAVGIFVAGNASVQDADVVGNAIFGGLVG